VRRAGMDQKREDGHPGAIHFMFVVIGVFASCAVVPLFARTSPPRPRARELGIAAIIGGAPGKTRRDHGLTED
jgi:hypothetical protein